PRLLPAVTGAADGRDAVRAELGTQVPDVHVDDVRPRVEVQPPHAAEKLLTAEHLTGVAQELLRECELPGGEIELLAADRRAPGERVEHDVLVDDLDAAGGDVLA